MTTTSINDFQGLTLQQAASRDDGQLYPLPKSGDAAHRQLSAVNGLYRRGMAAKVMVEDEARVWSRKDDQLLGLVITEAGRAAIGVVQGGETSDNMASVNADLDDATDSASSPPDTDQQPSPSKGKQALIIGLLTRDEGATLDQMVAATGWLPHTTRAALTGLKKKGHAVTSDKIHKTRTYRIITRSAA